MDSLFEATARAAVIQRIEKLQPDATPQWGKLTNVQMLAHCQKPLLVALGELKLKRSLIGRLLGGMAKKKFVESTAAFKQSLPTDPRFLVRDTQDFAHEQAELIALVKRFAEPGALTVEVHPFFGTMTPANWDSLMYKHLDHHLRQFGA